MDPVASEVQVKFRCLGSWKVLVLLLKFSTKLASSMETVAVTANRPVAAIRMVCGPTV